MENEKVKTLALAMGQIYEQGADEDVEALFKAACGLYIRGEISIEELQWLKEQMKSNATDYDSVDGVEADETVLWLRNAASAAEASVETLDVVIQRAAEYLHDYWSEII